MLLVVLATFTLDSAASVLVASITGKPVAWPPIVALVTGVAGGWLVVAMWCLAGAFLGILVRGTALGVGIGLVWALAVENLLRIFGSIVEVMDVVQRFLPGTNAGAWLPPSASRCRASPEAPRASPMSSAGGPRR
jgi:hypothetical protein